jgi:TRAP-type mannitol/chloroaromatic compound transport system permease small subunit
VPQVLAAIDRLSRLGCYAACACVAAATLLVLAEIAARKVFGTSLDFAWEYAAYLSAMAFLLGAGQALATGAHVRVQLVLDMLPARGARALDTIAGAGTLAIAAYLAWAVGKLAWHSYLDGTRSFLPSNSLLYPFQVAFALGAALLVLQAAARVVRLVRGEAVA